VLPRHNRLTSPSDFERAFGMGRRRGSSTLVVHFWCCDEGAGPARVGLAVGRRVGNSVQRHKVSRRLRHLAADRLDQLPAGSLLVLRAVPGAADAPADVLAGDLDRALARLGVGTG
jgi:ribonuclease P protein component